MGNFPVRSEYILSVAFVTALMNMVVPVWGSGSGCGSIGGTVGCCVDWRIWRSWSRCPLTVWIDLPRCLVTSFLFKPGNYKRNPTSMASQKVERVGNPSDVSWSRARSAFFVSARMIAFAGCTIDTGGVSSFNCTIHIPFVYCLSPWGIRCPMRMMLPPLLRMIRCHLENFAVHP